MKKSDRLNSQKPLIVLFCCVCVMLTVLACDNDSTEDPALQVSGADQPLPYSHPDWMSYIPDDQNLYLSELSIPGTHDPAADLHTAQVASASQWEVICQDFRMANQLLLGVRWFDIRLRDDDGVLTAFHGPFYLHKNFDDELGYALDFLRDHPTETVIFTLKQEHSSKSDRDFGNAVYSYLERHGLDNFYLTNDVPLLKDVRGKIVIIRRFINDTGHKDFGMDFDWADNTEGASFSSNGINIFVEDHYKLNTVSYSEKIREIQNCITGSRNEGDRKKFYLCYTSGEQDAGRTLHSIGHIAENVQPPISDWLRNSGQQRVKRSGVILVNFAGGEDTDKDHSDRRAAPELVENILKLNSGQPLWATNTYGHWGATYKMQDDGNFVILDKDGITPLWASNTWGHPGAQFAMQGDGNFVIYSETVVPLWATDTYGYWGADYKMQGDGNFVIYMK